MANEFLPTHNLVFIYADKENTNNQPSNQALLNLLTTVVEKSKFATTIRTQFLDGINELNQAPADPPGVLNQKIKSTI